MQLLAGAYQRRQQWLAEMQAAEIAKMLGADPGPRQNAGQPQAPPDAPRDSSKYMRSTTGKVYEKIDPFEMMRIVNGS